MGILIKNIDYQVEDKHILKNINLNINEGEILAIMGPNGSGKSTLVKILAGDFYPNKGKIFFDKIDLRNISIQEQANIRSVMSQSQKIVYNYSVKEIIEMGWIKKQSSKDKEYSFDEALKKVSFECDVFHLLNRKYNSLSGGEKRSVNFARTLIQLFDYEVTQNKYIILDEPTANLDPAATHVVEKIISKIKKSGTTIVMATHDLGQAKRLADNILFLYRGRVLENSSVEKFFSGPKNDLAQSFLRGELLWWHRQKLKPPSELRNH